LSFAEFQTAKFVRQKQAEEDSVTLIPCCQVGKKAIPATSHYPFTYIMQKIQNFMHVDAAPGPGSASYFAAAPHHWSKMQF
jgi:hypothetical protein